MASQYGRRLDPYRHLRQALGVKGLRQSVAVTNNPSTIGENQLLLVRFPNLGYQDVIVPGTARLAFTIRLTSADPNRTVVQNLGRAIIRKTTVKISGNEVLSVDDSDVYGCYCDLWRTSQARENSVYQGIDTSEGRNVLKLRVGAEDGDKSVASDKAVADTYGNRFFIPLDFELLESHMPFYQSALGDRLEYELTFNDYSRVISVAGEATYTIENISLEFDKVAQTDLAREIRNQYSGRFPFLYNRVLRYRYSREDKSKSGWIFDIDVPARSLQGVMILCVEPPSKKFGRDTERFYNPKITKVDVTVEGVPNQLFSQGMRSYQQWDEARKFFAGGMRLQPEVAMVVKDLELADVSLSEYLTEKFVLWLDMRTSDDDYLHGSGRPISAKGGLSIHVTKKEEAAGPLDVYVYIIMDAQLNIENGRYVSVVY